MCEKGPFPQKGTLGEKKGKNGAQNVLEKEGFFFW